MADVNRKKAYFWLMGTCIGLILLAWNVVRFWSIPVAVGMSIVAAVIPPLAAVVGNFGSMRESEPRTFNPGPHTGRDGEDSPSDADESG